MHQHKQPDHEPQKRKRYEPDPEMVERVRCTIQRFPAGGYRFIWSIIRHLQGYVVNKKKIYRIMKRYGWLKHQRKMTPRPRVKARRSRASRSDERWAMDITHIHCGEDGWGHLVAIIDCHDRQCIGYEFALRGRAKEAERALEAACINRFGTLYPEGRTPVIRSDNGLVFLSKKFRQTCRAFRLQQEFITPYSPQQNGLVERFFRSVKEECVYLHNFSSFKEAKYHIERWLEWYNHQRPHQALNYASPVQFRTRQQALQVA